MVRYYLDNTRLNLSGYFYLVTNQLFLLCYYLVLYTLNLSTGS
jgi:hypothetical protein